jgi:hypothetical protein
VGPDKEVDSTSVIINEVQLLLAEKRATLASMRAGIAVFALPLSVLSVLISASKYGSSQKTMRHFWPGQISQAVIKV